MITELDFNAMSSSTETFRNIPEPQRFGRKMLKMWYTFSSCIFAFWSVRRFFFSHPLRSCQQSKRFILVSWIWEKKTHRIAWWLISCYDTYLYMYPEEKDFTNEVAVRTPVSLYMWNVTIQISRHRICITYLQSHCSTGKLEANTEVHLQHPLEYIS